MPKTITVVRMFSVTVPQRAATGRYRHWQNVWVIFSAAVLIGLFKAPMSLASDQSALEWLVDNAPPSLVGQAGQWATPSGTLYAIDPLTLFGSDFPITDIPTQPADVLGFYPLSAPGRIGLLALVWSDTPVHCGKDVGTIGVDTGLAAFVSAADVEALKVYGNKFEGDLYAGQYAEMIEKNYPGPMLIDLDGMSGFPLAGSGWGDGGYPVATLKDAGGNVTAIYSRFITDGQDWVLPSACDDATS